MENPITRAEHEEFRRRMEAEHKRQDKRIEILEESTRRIESLTVSVAEMAQSVKQMAQELDRQGARMEELEGRDGDMWRRAVGYAVTAVIGIVIGFIFKQIGM